MSVLDNLSKDFIKRDITIGELKWLTQKCDRYCIFRWNDKRIVAETYQCLVTEPGFVKPIFEWATRTDNSNLLNYVSDRINTKALNISDSEHELDHLDLASLIKIYTYRAIAIGLEHPRRIGVKYGLRKHNNNIASLMELSHGQFFLLPYLFLTYRSLGGMADFRKYVNYKDISTDEYGITFNIDDSNDYFFQYETYFAELHNKIITLAR
jgi:hypothetical protein